MQKVSGHSAALSIPLVLLATAHLWLFQGCVAGLNAARPPSMCHAPPLSTLALLALSFVELTRGSRVRGAIALAVVAIPLLLSVVSEVIN